MIRIAMFILILVSSVAFPQIQTSLQTQTQPEEPPSTDIYLVDLSLKDGKLQTGKVVNLTHRKGYDNQPAFFPDDQLYYTSIRGDQADIYAFNLKTNQTRQITNTPESEYSPTLTPDRKYISVVRVEADKSQRLWMFPLDGGAPLLVLEKVEPVGYHLWMNNEALLLYILGEPVRLWWFHRAQKGFDAKTIAENVGRCLQRIPNSAAISYVEKDQQGEWWIQQVEIDEMSWTKKSSVKALPTEEHDYTWTPDGTILAAQESRLYGFTPGKDSDWRLIADFSAQELKEITRIAVSPDGAKMALVAKE